MKKSVATIVLSFVFGASYAQTVVNVEMAGDLSKKITEAEKYTITDLTVSGDINGTDILFLREMAGRTKEGKETKGKLATLNLFGANIVAGGENYFMIKRGLSVRYYKPSENDVICPYMFYKCGALQKLTLPTGATAIDQYALSGCASLTECTLPQSVENIREYAFSDCKELTSVGEFPATLSDIGTKAFYNTAIKAYAVAEENEDYAVENGVLYSKDKISLMLYPTASTAQTFNVSSECTNIETNAFAMATNLKGITLPADISTVGKAAFEKSGLTTLTVEASVISIANSAFLDCKDLKTVTFKGNAGLEQDAFKNCYNLTTVQFGGESVPECQANVFTPGKSPLHIYVPADILDQCKKYFTDHNVVKGGKNYEVFAITPSHISDAFTGNLPTEQAHFNVAGCKIDKHVKGLHIIRLSDGSIIKRIVK